MKKIIFALVAAGVMGFISCENPLKKEVQQMSKEVMEVHDGVMPKMDNIHEARKELKTKLITSDSVEAAILIAQLDAADEAMMVWMEKFNSNYESMPLQEQKKYLEAEMKNIAKVRDLMLSALKDAEKWMQNQSQDESK